MRQLTQALLTKINTKMGIEPFIAVGIQWSPGSEILYADKDYSNAEGRILELSDINSILRVDSGGSSESVTIKLDDTDGTLRTIYESVDIHKRHVVIYQGFSSVSDVFPVFEGVISSPIVWSEGERTLSFEIVNKVEDREVGFSPEEGRFFDLPIRLLGKPWPIPFGTVRYSPTILLSDHPTSLLITGWGIADWGLDEQIARLNRQIIGLPDYPQGLQTYFDANGDTEELNRILKDNQKTIEAFNLQREESIQSIHQEITKLQDLKNQQEMWTHIVRAPIFCTMDNFNEIVAKDPIVSMNGWIYEASFERHEDSPTLGKVNFQVFPHINLSFDGITVDSNSQLQDYQNGVQNSPGFVWHAPGSQINLISETPTTHVVSCVKALILGVYAYRNFKGVRQISLVPGSYYKIIKDAMLATTNNFSDFDGPNRGDKSNWFRVLEVSLHRPLSYAKYGQIENLKLMLSARLNKEEDLLKGIDEQWEDDIFVSLQSELPSNPVMIIAWLIDNFSTYEWDEDSFNGAAGYLGNYPANFILMEKKNLITIVTEIAIQARCSIWIRGYKFFIRYLPAEPNSVDTITDDDIEFGSLKLMSTDTENIVTKYTAIFKTDYLPETGENKIILRSNIAKYGVQEEEVNYYIYNTHHSVKKSALFWIIRKSNTWKRVSFKCFLNKLHLETMDCVTIDFETIKVCNTPVKGIIESAIYNSDENRIEMIVWLPILLGSMEQYNFAWPSNVSDEAFYPPGGPSGGAIASFQPVFVQKSNPKSVSDSNGSGFVESNLNDNERTVDTEKPDDEGGKPSDQAEKAPIKSNYWEPEKINPATIKFNYKLKDVPIKFDDIPLIPEASSSVFPGVVTGGSANSYSVTIYKNGLNEDGTNVTAKQLQIDVTDAIPVGTWCLVAEGKEPDSEDEAKTVKVYYIQVPIWV